MKPIGIEHGPERLQGQGLDREQEESGNRAILALLADPETRDQVDLVLTWREAAADAPAAYEAWSRRGCVRFARRIGADGALAFEVLEVIGENPLARQDPAALRSVEQEARAAERSGFDGADPTRRFIASAEQSYPFAYERVAQLFDSPNAPDLAVSPEDWAQGIQPGTHGALNVRQSRAPLWLAGPRVRPGRYELGVRSVDVAPTALAACGFPAIDGADATGRTSSERGVAPDVLLRRQDGRVLEELLDRTGAPAPTPRGARRASAASLPTCCCDARTGVCSRSSSIGPALRRDASTCSCSTGSPTPSSSGASRTTPPRCPPCAGCASGRPSARTGRS